MRAGESFFNPLSHGLVRVAAAMPVVQVADPAHNGDAIADLLRRAAGQKAQLVVFPELSISAYTCDDLFHQRALIDGCRHALVRLVEASRDLPLVAVVGLPLVVDQRLFNCAAVFSRGRILGVVTKTYPPNYREYYELRHFSPGDDLLVDRVAIGGQAEIPIGNQLLFTAADIPDLRFHVEICEDLWVPIPPSSFAALGGATILCNLSASNATIGKDDYRRQLVANQSGRCLAAYVYSAAGWGESTTDLAWDGHSLIYENGGRLAESMRYSAAEQLVIADVDVERLAQERMRQTSFGHSVARHKEQVGRHRTVEFTLTPSRDERVALHRRYERFPYVPSRVEERDHRCEEVYHIQVQGLVKRLQASGISKVVVGVSGGLDSTQALLVCARAMDLIGESRKNILGCTMPGFATSERTLAQARELMKAIGCEVREIDIRPSCQQLLADIGHPHRPEQPVYDVTFENVQAGERTNHLFRLANLGQALVVGTGDLSELALGWCTYGVGDHMSHYAVNASVPKTLIQYLIRWVADRGELGGDASDVLRRILSTDISPELVPGDEATGQPAQSTESVLGPYALHDFFLYYILRFGFAPPKVAFLARAAWSGSQDDDGEVAHYSLADIKRHLGVFLHRFFQLSQFKRSCIPNAPKVGTGGSLSPRGDYRAPSDSGSAVWLAQLDDIPDEE